MSPTDGPAGSQDMILGEMRGQLREVVHAVNNLSGKFDGLSREVIGLGVIGTEVADIKRRVSDLENEADELKEDRDRRMGAFGFANSLRLWAPALLALLGIGVMILKSMGKL